MNKSKKSKPAPALAPVKRSCLLIAVPRDELMDALELSWGALAQKGYRTLDANWTDAAGSPSKQWRPNTIGGVADTSWDDTWNDLALLREGKDGILKGKPILLQQNW